jgi:hypothetical protein
MPPNRCGALLWKLKACITVPYRRMGDSLLPLGTRRELRLTLFPKSEFKASSNRGSERAGLGAVLSRVQENANPLGHRREADILGQPFVIAVIDLLDDRRQLEPGEHQVEHSVRNRASAFQRVTFDQLAPCQAAWKGRRPPADLL